MDATTQVRGLAEAFRLTAAVAAAVELGLPGAVAAGPRTAGEVAAACGCHPPTLQRLLRVLVAAGLVEEDGDGCLTLTAAGELLRDDVPGSLADWVRFVTGPSHQAAWRGLAEAVRSGKNAFTLVHGTGSWQWREEHPEERAVFDAAMSATTAALAGPVAAAYDFGRLHTLVDVGGGRGTLLAALLRAHPGLRGVLVDQPAVVAGAPDVLAAAGVADRCTVVGGDSFSAVPDGDGLLLKFVVHDWPDEDAVRVLATCRRAVRPDGVLLLVERLLGEGPDPLRTALADLTMLVGPGGRERSRDEYARLLAAAGFRLERVLPTGTTLAVLEAVPVGA